MFRFGSMKSTLTGIKKFAFTSCDEEENDDDFDVDSSPSLIEQVLQSDTSIVTTIFDYLLFSRLMRLSRRTKGE